jgi:two-component system, NtrC family, response regulator AtoC
MICSTRHNIERELNKGNFREDLFYSVNIVCLRLPPLRSRREDIPGLVHYFWETYRATVNSPVPKPSPRLTEAFEAHDWPGNIRELANMMRLYVGSGSEKEILDKLAAWGSRHPVLELSTPGIALKNLAKQESREIERKIIFRTLRESRWNRKQAARVLNISYRTLLYKIKEVGLPPKREVMRQEREN